MTNVRLMDDRYHLLGMFDSTDDAFKEAGEMFERGDGEVFHVDDDGLPYHLFGHQLMKFPCPICGKKVMSLDAVRTYDCHGIPFRKVCPDCYDRVMEEKGYDGEYYSAFDECIDYDY